MYFVLKAIKRYLTLPIFLLIVLFALPTSASTLPVLIEQNMALVPLRFLSETLSYTVNFTGDKNPITLTNGISTLQFTVGSNILTINDTPITLHLTIKKINGTTMVPLKVFSENLGTTTLFEDGVLYLSNGSYYWIWELDNGKTILRSLIPQRFLSNNKLTVTNETLLDKLLDLSSTELRSYFPGSLKIPGTSNYIAYIRPNPPKEATLTFHYDLSRSKSLTVLH